MKDVFIGSAALVAFFLLVVLATDKTIECDKIPENQKYKYAVISGKTKKCVPLSKKEIEELEEEEENIENANIGSKLWGVSDEQ